MASMMQAQHQIRRTNSQLGRQLGRDYAPVPGGSAYDGDGGHGAGPANDCEGLLNIVRGQPILTGMLVFVPIGFAAHLTEMAPPFVFGFNFLAIIPLAWLIGKSTEDVAASLAVC